MPGDMANTPWSDVVFGAVTLLAGIYCFIQGVRRD